MLLILRSSQEFKTEKVFNKPKEMKPIALSENGGQESKTLTREAKLASEMGMGIHLPMPRKWRGLVTTFIEGAGWSSRTHAPQLYPRDACNTSQYF